MKNGSSRLGDYARRRAGILRSPVALPAVGAALVLGAVASVSVVALAVVLLDGMVAWGVLAAAGLAGGWVFPVLGIREARVAERIILGGAVGIGMLSLAVLGLGALGLLSFGLLTGLLVALGVAGVMRLWLDVWGARKRHAGARGKHSPSGRTSADKARSRSFAAPRMTNGRNETSQATSGDGFTLVLLALAPFFVVMLLACALPPGVLWAEEGFGYDILEYHLGVPKAFHEAGRITFLPENVYSNFPLNYEMLALAMMTLHGEAIEAAFMAKMVNVVLAGLFMGAAWLAGREWSARAGVIAAVLAGTAPWLTYLTGIAYVETGMLAMGMASWACVLRALRGPEREWRWVLLGGLMAGLACGFKYTAVPFVALPAVVLVFVAEARWRIYARDALLVGAGALLTFSPWLIRNAANTGNPVFPLAYGVFGADEAVWSAELAQRWEEGHARPEPAWADEGVAARLLHGVFEAWRLSLGDFRVGWLLLVLAVIGIVTRRDRVTLVLIGVLALQAVVWYEFTHHFARFAAVMILPLALLGARAFARERAPLMVGIIAGLLVLGAGYGFLHIAATYRQDKRVYGNGDLYGRTQLFVKAIEPAATLNTLGPEAKILLVGEARTFYLIPPVEYAVVFNRHPLEAMLEAVSGPQGPDEPLTAERADRLLNELQERRITHIFVNWSEVRRLRRTYGFPTSINEALFARLEAAGLVTVKRYLPSDSEEPWAVLYEIRRHSARQEE